MSKNSIPVTRAEERARAVKHNQLLDRMIEISKQREAKQNASQEALEKGRRSA